jgi:transcriptional regulator with XRE-family HTH domain
MIGVMSTALDIEVRAALEARRGDWKRIAEDSGVSYSWISKFVNGHIPNPGFATLRDLHARLAAVQAATAQKAA